MKVLDQGGSAIPRHPARDLGDIVAETRRERDCRNGDLAEIRCEGRKALGNLIEPSPIELDQVHLIHGEHDLPDTEQATNKGVPLGLRQHAFARVDKDHGEFGGRSAGRHIARVLLVPRRIGDDKGALRRRKEAIGDVDRDALLPLVLEPVEQQREIKVVAGRTETPGFALQRAELVVEDRTAFVEQPADQCRFAVVDRPAGQQTQQILARPSGRLAMRAGHQK